MGKMKEMQITIEEVARIALENPKIRDYVGHELDISDEYLQKVFDYLEGMLNPETATQGDHR